MRPFSHQPGIECLLPRTCWSVQAFPTRLFLRDRQKAMSSAAIEIPLHLHGPVREFTVLQDLEKGCVFIWGIAKEGHFRLRLQAGPDAIELWVDRGRIECQGRLLKTKERMSWNYSGPYREPDLFERLSLGSHRSQDWNQVWPRLDPKEILPVLFHLSQWIPSLDSTPSSGMFYLLEQGWDDFLPAAFSGILIPRLIDDQFQGLLEPEEISPQASPCALIAKAGEKIRKLFIQPQGMTIELSFAATSP